MDQKELASRCVKLSLKFEGLHSEVKKFRDLQHKNQESHLYVEQFLKSLDIIQKGLQNYHEALIPENIHIEKSELITIRRSAYEALQEVTTLEGLLRKLLRVCRELKSNTNSKVESQMQVIISEILSHLERSNLLVSELSSKIQIYGNIKGSYEVVKKRLLKLEDIESGDILMAFKSQEFLKSHTGSRIVSIATQSSVTHTMLAIRKDGVLYTLDSNLYGLTVRSGLKINKIKLEPGEVFIVLRPHLSPSQRQRFFEVAREHLNKKYRYAYLKAIGLVPSLLYRNTVGFFTKHVVDVPNIFGMSKNAVFCSEIIEMIMRDVGLRLCPHEDPSMVIPRDILLSPKATFIGFCFEESQQSEEHIMKLLSHAKI